MKKFFSVAVTVLAMVAAFSSCKKSDLSDEQLTANIASNQNYAGKYLINNVEEDEAVMVLTKSASTGVQEFAVSLISDIPDADDPTSIYMVGTWSVSGGVLTLKATKIYGESKTATATGTVESNGDKFTLTSGKVTFKDMKKVTK